MLRGRDVTRLEGFTDAVLGFAVTLLVVSLEVPENFQDLQRALIGFPAFAVTFAVICWIWYEHYLLFRSYRLEDGLTVVLNGALLFLVLFYAYPLKFLFTRLIGSLLGVGPGIGAGMTAVEGRQLMLVYSAGFVALFLTFLLLHGNALRQRRTLALSPLQVYDARTSIGRHAINVGFGLLSMTIALVAPPQYLAVAGAIFFGMGPAHGVYGYRRGRGREPLESSATAGEPEMTAPPDAGVDRD